MKKDTMTKDTHEEGRHEEGRHHEEGRRNEEELGSSPHLAGSPACAGRGLSPWMALACGIAPARRRRRKCRRLFSLLLARGIARVARGLAFGLERCFSCRGLFLFAAAAGRRPRRRPLLRAASARPWRLRGPVWPWRVRRPAPRARPAAPSPPDRRTRAGCETCSGCSCLASCAAFCRSAKLGSLNPLIDRALSLSWLVVRRSAVARPCAA